VSTRVLRAKYMDYCSARVADVLLTLSPDEIYVIAEAESRRASGQGTPGSYTEAVDLATRRVRKQLELPGFLDWAEAYVREPERYDAYLLGLWESEEGSTDD
jgi:hypothetical protein